MTIEQMHIEIQLYLNRISSDVYDGFEAEEIDLFIDKAVSRKINSILSVERDDLRLGFQGDQKRLDDIRTLVTPDYSVFLSLPLDESSEYVFLPLPENYRNLVNLRVALFDKSCGTLSPDCIKDPTRGNPNDSFKVDLAYFESLKGCNFKVIPARALRQNKVFDLLRNPFARSTADSPVATISGNNFQIFQGKNFIVCGIIADYIRKPENVSLSSNVDCELADHVHPEIVDLVVNHMLEVTGNPRFQSSSQDITRSE